MTFTELERLAVVEAEVRHLTRQHEESRVEVRNEFREVRDEIKSVKNDVAEIKQLLTQAKGGWLALRGGWRTVVYTGGAIGIVATYVWDWFAPLLRALPR
ncbi:hypothetical protein [Ancylobacter oerskovii]|uniref:DUF1515 domain-containing protein n=1 Tax=Ancylobacter oerskovii TaxID=459519 RepID=A0ABW4Z361_9HYPH|nr:hypothetical protein [Ancylobacter oerskovii]MBS7546266.1 hypothetical protein [Ancylobacter oerskovii]